jgi:Ala-tRNA(Pro) deacylase
MSFQRLIDHLNNHQAKFSLEAHSKAFTALEVAERAHVHGLNMGKVVVLLCDESLVLCLLPAHYHVNCTAFAEETGVSEVRLALENEFSDHFPQCELGAIPPFSELWGLPIYMSFAFDIAQDLAFNAGNWSEIARMPCTEYIRVEEPRIISKGAMPPSITRSKVSSCRG